MRDKPKFCTDHLHYANPKGGACACGKLARVDHGAAEIAQLRQELVGSVKAETHAFAVRKAEEYLTELQALRDAQARLLTLVQQWRDKADFAFEAAGTDDARLSVDRSAADVLNQGADKYVECADQLEAALERDPGSRSRPTQEKGIETPHGRD